MDARRDDAAIARAIQRRGYPPASGPAKDLSGRDSVLAPGPYLLRSAAAGANRGAAPDKDRAGGERSSAALRGFRVVNAEHRRGISAAAALVFLAGFAGARGAAGDEGLRRQEQGFGGALPGVGD